MGERFFWYRPTRVVPDKGPLDGCLCVLTAGLSRPKSDSKLSRQQHQSPATTAAAAARFYDVPPQTVVPTMRPRTYRVLRLCKADLDRANKDKQHRLYTADFAVCRFKLILLPGV